jgi:NADH-quinone oxidoreductase subunit D
VWIGGVWNDITDDQLRRIKKFIDNFDEELKVFHSLVGENKIFIERTANVGIVSEEMAYQYGATGPVLRGSGIDWDLRKKRPYGIYEEFDFDAQVGRGEKGTLGDCWDRYDVRVREMHESVKIVRQCLEGIEEGSIMGKVPKVLKVPEGEIYMRTECPRGELGYHLVSDGGKTPYRLKVKSSCFTHVSMLPEMAPGQMVADFVASIGSIDIVLGEVDR